MIDSILGRWKKSIITDQLVIKFPNQNTEVVTDFDHIKLLICNHMYEWTKDKCTSVPPELGDEWDCAFEPILSIPENKINTIIFMITLEEFETALQDLSARKASELLGITNEMFKIQDHKQKNIFYP